MVHGVNCSAQTLAPRMRTTSCTAEKEPERRACRLFSYPHSLVDRAATLICDGEAARRPAWFFLGPSQTRSFALLLTSSP